MPHAFCDVGRKRRVASRRGVIALLVVRVVAGVDGGSRRDLQRLSTLGGGTSSSGSVRLNGVVGVVAVVRLLRIRS